MNTGSVNSMMPTGSMKHPNIKYTTMVKRSRPRTPLCDSLTNVVTRSGKPLSARNRVTNMAPTATKRMAAVPCSASNALSRTSASDRRPLLAAIAPAPSAPTAPASVGVATSP